MRLTLRGLLCALPIRLDLASCRPTHLAAEDGGGLAGLCGWITFAPQTRPSIPRRQTSGADTSDWWGTRGRGPTRAPKGNAGLAGQSMFIQPTLLLDRRVTISSIPRPRQ